MMNNKYSMCLVLLLSCGVFASDRTYVTDVRNTDETQCVYGNFVYEEGEVNTIPTGDAAIQQICLNRIDSEGGVHAYWDTLSTK